MTEESIEISVKGKWMMVPALRVDGKYIIQRGKWLKTAQVNAEQWLTTPVEDPELLVKVLKEERRGRIRADVFTFTEMLPQTEPQYRYSFERESIAAIPITTYDAWWTSLPQETRKNVRRAEKRGVKVEVRPLDDRLLDDIVELNNDAPVRQGKTYTHFGKTREQVNRDQQDFLDHCDYICAYHETELVGLVKLIYRGQIASILTFLPKTSQSDKRPANALIAKAVEICAEKGLRHLVFGLFNYYNKKDTSLREFKVRNGFEEVLVPRYFVPLTWKGALAVRLHLQQGLIAVLPHSVITTLVNTRARLNRLRKGRCSSMTEQSNRNRQMGRLNPPAGSNS